jgi:simple sugar transport system permease protein
MQKNKLSLIQSIGVPLGAILVSLVIGGIFILAIGQNPVEIYALLFEGTFGTSYDIGQVLFKSTPLIFTGLAVAFAFRAGLFNIGAEGQLYIGAMLGTLTGIWIPAKLPFLPSVIVVPLCLTAGFLGGGIWGLIPGWLKAKFGVHEVINTIMMNFIAYGLTNYLVLEVFPVPETIHTPEIGLSARIPRFDAFMGLFRGSPVNFSLLIALGCALIAWGIITKTRLGYEIRAVGLNPKAAEYAGIPVAKTMTLAFFIAGGLAGLAGSNFIQGFKYYYEDGFAAGVGFMGIAVALVARNNPIGIIFSALLFGILSQGGLAINSQVPKELVEILEAVVILVMVVMTELFNRWLIKQKKHS